MLQGLAGRWHGAEPSGAAPLTGTINWTGHTGMPRLGSPVDYLAQDFVSDGTPVYTYFRHLPSSPLKRVKAALRFLMGALEMIYK